MNICRIINHYIMSGTKVRVSFLLFFLLTIPDIYAEEYKITIHIEGLKDTSIYIGYHLGDKKYVADTLHLDHNGTAIYEGEESLPGGVYLLILPDMNFAEFIVDENQRFSINTTSSEPGKNIKFTGSDMNDKFLQYQQFMAQQQEESSVLREKRESLKENKDSVEAISGRLGRIDKRVKKYWDNLVKENKGTLLGNLIQALIIPEVPVFEIPEGAANVDSLKWIMGYAFNRDHFLDNIEFTDERLLRTPVIHSKLDQYFNRVLIQRPDSVIPQIRNVVSRTKGHEEVFQYVIVFLYNNFQNSTIMGMDEVYVQVAEDFYLSGQATWADSTFLANLNDRVSKMKPNLIGRTAKDLTMETITGEWVSLHQVNARYIVLYFWEPNCGFCKEATPMLYEIYTKYREKGLEIFAIYTQDNKEEWQEYLDENGFDWINAYDPNQATYFRFYYDVYSTPVVYLLDKDKVIVAKRVSVETLDKMLETML